MNYGQHEPALYLARKATPSWRDVRHQRVLSLALSSAIAGGAFFLSLVAVGQHPLLCPSALGAIGFPAFGVALASIITLWKDENRGEAK